MAGLSLVDSSYELIDPCPDIHALFIEFDRRFFDGALACCEVKWSPRMYSCAGVCSYEVRGGRGGLCSIRLSKPLLQLRPRKDLVETLLHEMIHAFLFVKERNRDRDGHGPQFQFHMRRINSVGGCNITIYHSFHEEVALYKQHVWRCDGPCQNRRPFNGYVKRSSNRAPGPNDRWWSTHQASCGGKFIKIKEPEGYGQKKTGKKVVPPAPLQPKGGNTLDKYFVPNKKDKILTPTTSTNTGVVPFTGAATKVGSTAPKTSSDKSITPFAGAGVRLGGTSTGPKYATNVPAKRPRVEPEVIIIDDDDDDELESSFVADQGSSRSDCSKVFICPSCNQNVNEMFLNSHLDHCLA